MESPAKRPVSKIAVEGMCITHVPSCVSCKIYLAILGYHGGGLVVGSRSQWAVLQFPNK